MFVAIHILSMSETFVFMVAATIIIRNNMKRTFVVIVYNGFVRCCDISLRRKRKVKVHICVLGNIHANTTVVCTGAGQAGDASRTQLTMSELDYSDC